MAFTRRRALASSAGLLLSAWSSVRYTYAASPAVAALNKSGLIYLTPLVARGRESQCQGEVWFVYHKEEIFVSTPKGTWRAEAVRRGYRRAKIWIGEFGVWKSAERSFRSAPYLELTGKLETDIAVHTEVLGVFGSKYTAEWDKWGPRFRDGLADGSRVLLRYQID